MARLCALLLAALLALSGAAAAQERPHLSSDPEVNRARALVRAGEHEAALAILRPMAAEAPRRDDRTDILFLTGLAAMRAAERPGRVEAHRDALLDEAVAALRAILVERPGLVRVRLELARAFYLKREDGLARGHFERVLAGNPPPAMEVNIRRFLGEMRARKRWTARFGVALASDSNPGAASADDTVHIHIFGQSLPFRRASDAGPKPGLGVAAWGGAEYEHPVHERLRLRAGADLSRVEHRNKAFDRTSLSVHAGPRWLADADTELSLLASARRHLTAGESHSRETGLRVEAERRLTRRLTAEGQASWHRRTHASGPALDGPVTAASLELAWLATPQLRLDALAGWSRERAREERWRNQRRRARLGASIALPHGFTLGAGVELRRTDYDGRWFLLTPGNVPRADRTRILSVSLLHRAFTVRGFSPRLGLVRETRKSNAQLHDYRRTRVELSFVRRF